MGYSPKYVAVGDVPYVGPDPWSDAEKLDKIEDAEGKLESDVNNGRPIPETQRERIHATAVRAYATHLLAIGPKAPSNASMGEIVDNGTGRADYADRLLAVYESTRDSILAAEEDASDDPSNARVGFDVF